MTNVLLKANGASLTASADNKITSGMVGASVNIEYDSSWSGLTKNVLFKVGNFTRVQKNVGTSTTIPWEVLRNPGGVLVAGIEGRSEDGEIVIPTVWATVAKILPGANGDIPAAPNPENGEPGTGTGAVIDDSQISSNTTWSSKKISDEIGSGGGGGDGDGGYVLTEEDKEEIAQIVIEKLPVYNGETEDVTIISFTINSETYQAEYGMTWGEWIESKYNTGYNGIALIVTDYGNIATEGGIICIVNYTNLVSGSDHIIAEYSYSTIE